MSIKSEENSNKQTKSTQSQSQSQNQFPQFRHAYSPQRRTPFVNIGPAVTKQSFKDECDINTIMGRYLKTGVLDFVNKHEARYTDLSDARDYQTAMLIVAEAKSMFEDLPSKIRTQFENDPAKFLDFVHNPENLPQMAEMGLLRPGAQVGTPTPTPTTTTQPTPVPAPPEATPPVPPAS